ncbi:hypothetical protein C5167_025979 [Papaver somniferum]|uniref:Fe2OG dioxygenase domain-containing protein n=1 Tax=Papaver somniferum TaxID=3469 RepID=A0A4Y7JVZ4_PAPSO|nr:codeine O-demethylase-like [Papaver somniferum]RZC64222.1 hypothetical protein C5167_025979 [Papaver somniferum]
MDTKGVLSSPSQSQSTAQLKYVQELATSGEEPPPKYFHKNVNDKGNQVTTDDSLSVPIIDISRLTSNASIEEKEEEMGKLKSALNSWGMFQAVGHGIPQNLLDDMYNISKKFFDLPVEEKQRYALSKDDEIFDLQGFGSDSMGANINGQVLDWSDRLRYWPGDDSPLNFRRTLDEYSVQVRSVSEIILKEMAKSLGLEDDDFLNQLGDRQYVYTRFSFYPPCSRPDLVYGLKAHTDGGAITFLLQDPEVRGLQVHKYDQWVSVPCMPGALLVNIGDLLQIMSNGIFKSPLHRAVTNTERTRISVAMFYLPHMDQEIEPVAALIDESNPRKYRRMKAKDFLEAFFQTYLQGERVYDWASI